MQQSLSWQLRYHTFAGGQQDFQKGQALNLEEVQFTEWEHSH